MQFIVSHVCVEIRGFQANPAEKTPEMKRKTVAVYAKAVETAVALHQPKHQLKFKSEIWSVDFLFV
jgi:hypothetical protein